jgi:hypothetical protein
MKTTGNTTTGKMILIFATLIALSGIDIKGQQAINTAYYPGNRVMGLSVISASHILHQAWMLINPVNPEPAGVSRIKTENSLTRARTTMAFASNNSEIEVAEEEDLVIESWMTRFGTTEEATSETAMEESRLEIESWMTDLSKWTAK